MGKKPSTFPNSGLDGAVRVNPLAQKIVSNIVANPSGIDYDTQLLYNPKQWRDVAGNKFNETYNWLKDPVQVTVNGKQDSFSQRHVVLVAFLVPCVGLINLFLFYRLGPTCSQWVDGAPVDPQFQAEQIIILSNGRYVVIVVYS